MGSLSQKSSLPPPSLVCSDQDPQRKDNAAVAAAKPAVTDNWYSPIEKFIFHLYFAESSLVSSSIF